MGWEDPPAVSVGCRASHSRTVVGAGAIATLSITAVMLGLIPAVSVLGARWRARLRRSYARLALVPYRTDAASDDALVDLFEVLHKRLLQRWWRRLLAGQPSIALEVHLLPDRSGGLRAALAVACPTHAILLVRAALRGAYPNLADQPSDTELGRPPALLRLKKRSHFTTRLRVADPRRQQPPLVDRLLIAMRATGAPCLVQLALTPTPAWFERSAKRQYKRREQRLSDERDQGERRPRRERSEVEHAEL